MNEKIRSLRSEFRPTCSHEEEARAYKGRDQRTATSETAADAPFLGTCVGGATCFD